MELKNNHAPVASAPNRGFMPQTDKAGSVTDDSAVARMKEDPVMKIK